MDVLSAINTRRTSQTVQADPHQVENSAGGFTFTLDDEARLRRFLILGSDGGTYYASAAELTTDNAPVALRMARERGVETVRILTEISLAGRAPKQNPTLFTLAAVAGLADDEGRKAAFDALPRVARTGTHLFLFARYVEQFRGWGRGLRRAVGGWYTSKSVEDLAYQVAKYRQREGWSHRDLLRLSHPETSEAARKGLFDWISGREADEVPDTIRAFRVAQEATTVHEWVQVIRTGFLSWEMLPDAALGEPEVWEALLDDGVPMGALIRQLPRLTRLGVARSQRAQIAAQLTNPERLRKARIHPVNVLVAQRTYASGQSARGDSTWVPERVIVDALDEAFYKSFGNVEPAGKRTLLALDVSGSMAMAPISNMPLTPREASAAMALVTMASEPGADVVGFTDGSHGPTYHHDLPGLQGAVTPLTISPRQRLDDAIRSITDLRFGRTDCAAPMVYALKNGLGVDTFVIYTDNQTYAGGIHPHQALAEYRRATGIPARLIVVGMTATGFSIADPTDAGMLDVVGFDSATPQLISDFSRGF